MKRRDDATYSEIRDALAGTGEGKVISWGRFNRERGFVMVTKHSQESGKRHYPDWREVGRVVYEQLWEEVKTAQIEAASSMPANVHQEKWVRAKANVKRMRDGAVIVRGTACAERAEIFEELRRRACVPGAFSMIVPDGLTDKLEAIERPDEHDIPELLEKAIETIDKAFRGCRNDTIEAASEAVIEVNDDLTMQASADVVDYSFRDLLALAVEGLSVKYERGFVKARLPLADVLGKSKVDGFSIDGSKATFFEWRDSGFRDHGGWNEQWIRVERKSDDVEGVKALATLHKLSAAIDALVPVPEAYHPETWAFLPKGC